MANEPIQGGPYPLQSERADGPGAFKAVVDWAAPKLNMTFATTGERDAQLPSPEDGMVCTIGSGSAAEMLVYVDGAWRPIMTKAVAARLGGGTPTLPNGSTTPMDFGPLVYAHGGMARNGGKLVCPVDGIYAINAGARTVSESGYRIQMRVRVNSTYVVLEQVEVDTGYITVSQTHPCQAGDEIEVLMYSYGSSPIQLSANFGFPYLTAALIART